MWYYHSLYKEFANTSRTWLDSDTAERWQHNVKNRPQDLGRLGWTEHNVCYDFNSQGFRSPEFADQPTVMFVGCSNTCGIGLPPWAIWPTLVAAELRLRCANLGQGGTSSDTAFRLTVGWIDAIKPRILIFLQPPGIRWELLHGQSDNGGIAHFIAGMLVRPRMPAMKERFRDYMTLYSHDDSNRVLNETKNRLAMELLCLRRRVKFLHMPDLCIIEDDWARDLYHAGVRSHAAFAKTVLQALHSDHS